LQISIDSGSTKTLNGNKDLAHITNYDKANYDTPTTTLTKNVFLKIANNKNQPKGLSTFVAHFFNNPAAAGPVKITIFVLSVTTDQFVVYESTPVTV